jgi:hypothetical protein
MNNELQQLLAKLKEQGSDIPTHELFGHLVSLIEYIEKMEQRINGCLTHTGNGRWPAQ